MCVRPSVHIYFIFNSPHLKRRPRVCRSIKVRCWILFLSCFCYCFFFFFNFFCNTGGVDKRSCLLFTSAQLLSRENQYICWLPIRIDWIPYCTWTAQNIDTRYRKLNIRFKLCTLGSTLIYRILILFDSTNFRGGYNACKNNNPGGYFFTTNRCIFRNVINSLVMIVYSQS